MLLYLKQITIFDEEDNGLVYGKNNVLLDNMYIVFFQRTVDPQEKP